MRFTINLATKIYLDTVRINLVIGAVVVCLGLWLAYQVSEIGTISGEITKLSRELAGGAGVGKPEVSRQDYDRQLQRIKFANDIIARKTLNWQLLLDRLEGVVPDGVVLTAIFPNPSDGTLRLDGAAKGFANIRTLMENLESAPFYTEIYLVSQKEANIGDNRKGIAFSITCKAAMK